MNEQTKSTVERALQARIAQCTTQLEVLRSTKAPFVSAYDLNEHMAYWAGERNAAMSALLGLHSPELGV